MDRVNLLLTSQTKTLLERRISKKKRQNCKMNFKIYKTDV